MKLFWCPQTRSQRALWLMEESGLDYDRVLIDIRDASKPRDPDFIAASPMGKVPALADGDAKFSESAAIAIYIADRYGAGKLAPAIDDPARGKYLYWMLFTPGVIEPAITEKFSGATPNTLQNGWGDFDSMLSTFERGLAGNNWLVDNDFSAPDTMVGSSACFMKQFGMLPESKVLENYAARCMARPAYKRSVEINDAAA